MRMACNIIIIKGIRVSMEMRMSDPSEDFLGDKNGNIIKIIIIVIKIRMKINMRISNPSEDFLCDQVDAAVLRP